MSPDPTGSSPINWAAGAGAVLALLGVAAGAFGAHLLSGRLSADALHIFETGVRYQMYHALGLLALAALAARLPSGLWPWAAGLFIVGIFLFSGSLYLLALGGPRWLGAITPGGGVCLLAGWAVAVVAAWKGGS